MLTLLTLAVSPANAWVTTGNPKLTVSIDRSEADLTGGYGILDGVRVHECSGNYEDYTANVTFDPTHGWSTTIAGGDICMVEVLWDPATFVWSDDFELKSVVTSHNVKIGGATNTTPWTPFMVTEGDFFGSDPVVTVAFD